MSRLFRAPRSRPFFRCRLRAGYAGPRWPGRTEAVHARPIQTRHPPGPIGAPPRAASAPIAFHRSVSADRSKSSSAAAWPRLCAATATASPPTRARMPGGAVYSVEGEPRRGQLCFAEVSSTHARAASVVDRAVVKRAANSPRPPPISVPRRPRSLAGPCIAHIARGSFRTRRAACAVSFTASRLARLEADRVATVWNHISTASLSRLDLF